jgi:hypothetical protein
MLVKQTKQSALPSLGKTTNIPSQPTLAGQKPKF